MTTNSRFRFSSSSKSHLNCADFLQQLPGFGQVSWDLNMVFQPPCVGINAYTAPVSQFEASPPTSFVSNIFIEAIQNPPQGYSIIQVSLSAPCASVILTIWFHNSKNSHGVVVGELIGNGLLLNITSGNKYGQIITTVDVRDIGTGI